MPTLSLSNSQRRTLQILVDLYREAGEGHTIESERIAEGVDRSPGTIRNQMQSLRTLELVEGVPGPEGGYQPTVDAYQALGIQMMDNPVEVPFQHNREPVPTAMIHQIDLINIHHPDRCRAEIRLQGSVTDYQSGDRVAVGPTPFSDLRIEGDIHGIDTTDNRLIVTIDEMCAPAPGEPDH